MPSSREITLRFLADPMTVNILGQVHGGNVMKWIDEAAYACAAGWSGRHCVTIYVGGVRFHKPVHIGHLVEVHAKLIYTGTTSMHIAVDVSARDPREVATSRTTDCVVVFVALDAAGKPTPVPRFMAQTPEEQADARHAIRLMELSKAVDAELTSPGISAAPSTPKPAV